MQSFAKFFIVSIGFRFNGNTDHGCREVHGLEENFVISLTEGVSSFGGIETGNGVFVNITDTGTDPANPDTDNDGFNDGLEVEQGSLPTDKSSVPTGMIEVEVRGVTPSSGAGNGGTTITILGSGFESPATVRVGGVEALDVQVIDSSLMTAVAPAHETGPVVVQVFTRALAA